MNSRKPLAVFLGFGTDGHVNPLIGIAQALAHRGVDVRVLTHWPYVARYSYTGLPILPLDSCEEFHAMDAQFVLLNRPGTTCHFFERFVFPLARREVEATVRLFRGRNGVVVSTDAPGIGGRIAAEAAAQPFVSILTAPGFAFARPLYASMLQSRFEHRLGGLRREFGCTTPFPVNSWIYRVQRNIALWPEWFCLVCCVPEVDYAGFTWCKAAKSIEQQHRKEPGRKDIIITGGSASLATRRFFDVAVEASVIAGFTARVLSQHDHILPVLPDSVDRCRWEPDIMDSLAQTRLVIHHGGMGITGRCLALGLPQLILAAGGDRPENGRRVQELGVGKYLALDRANSTEVAELAKDLILSAETAERAKLLAARCSETRPSVAAEYIELVLGAL